MSHIGLIVSVLVICGLIVICDCEKCCAEKCGAGVYWMLAVAVWVKGKVRESNKTIIYLFWREKK
jgi:hypothetical protein